MYPFPRGSWTIAIWLATRIDISFGNRHSLISCRSSGFSPWSLPPQKRKILLGDRPPVNRAFPAESPSAPLFGVMNSYQPRKPNQQECPPCARSF